jgi:hypothetical protein
MSQLTECDLQCEEKCPIQTGRTCYACLKPLTVSSYNDARIKRIQSEITVINERYITNNMFDE